MGYSFAAHAKREKRRTLQMPLSLVKRSLPQPGIPFAAHPVSLLPSEAADVCFPVSALVLQQWKWNPKWTLLCLIFARSLGAAEARYGIANRPQTRDSCSKSMHESREKSISCDLIGPLIRCLTGFASGVPHGIDLYALFRKKSDPLPVGHNMSSMS